MRLKLSLGLKRFKTRGANMDNVITFTPAELVAFIGTVAGVCAGLATITGFIVAAVKKLRAPEVEQNRRIEALEKKVDELEKARNVDNNELAEIKKTDKVILKCLQALLAESLGGNATEALNEAKKELDNYFLEK